MRHGIHILSLLVSINLISLAAGFEPGASGITPEQLQLVRAAEARRVKVIQRVRGTVVSVYDSQRDGVGSAVVYDESGLALTNHHVVAAAGESGWAGLSDGRLYRWKLIGTDPGGDVAMIQLAGRELFSAATLADSDAVQVGDWALAMGNPFLLAEDQQPTVTLGIVSGVKRYQPGSGGNMLIYGNCIQFDTSISPGNSGGPLFNLRGEVIGINGRGSFDERGRVNVGLGYAISSNQIKNFLPDLLATKVAQHGTLDAVFEDRGGKIVCQSINLDAPVAQAGLRLGDELIEFETDTVSSSNQLTNVLSTLPAGWPTRLVYRRGGATFEVWVRLFGLPYPRESSVEKKNRSKDKDQDDPTDKTEKFISLANAGRIRNMAINRQNCRRLLARWKENVFVRRGATTQASFRMEDDMFEAGEHIGRQTLLFATDGRFRIDFEQEGKPKIAYGFDGSQFWSFSGGAGGTVLNSSKAVQNPRIAQIAVLATMLMEEPLQPFGNISLDGSDKAQGHPAYRLKTLNCDHEWFYVWLSVEDESQHPNVRLVKSGPDLDCNGPGGGVLYGDWRLQDGLRWPWKRQRVRGLAETEQLSFVTRNVSRLSAVGDDMFQVPGKQVPE